MSKTEERKLKIDDLKDGVKIMSIEARYIFKEQDKETGYDSSLYWTKEKDVLPRKLYKVKMPYSLGAIHWFGMEKSDFGIIKNEIYSNDIINVTFNNASKVIATYKNGIVKTKPRIKKSKKGKFELEIVDELVTDKSIDDLRNSLYGGFTLDNEKYVLFMRSPGKARESAILYIKESLIEEFLLWARMGIDFEEIVGEVDVAGLKAAESLILSEIKDIVTIKSNQILLIPDVKVPYTIPKGKASVTAMGNDGMAVTANNEEEIKIENDIFDGQALLVPEFYPKDKSMILLRNRFFKSAAFCFDIQKWFRDNGVISVNQLNGYTLAKRVEDIKLITTPNSLKFMKQKNFITFDEPVDNLERATYEYWLKKIEDDDCIFGVVKNEYASGFVKGYNYQVDNSLQLSKNELRELLQYEFNRIKKAKNNNDYFVNEFIKKKNHKSNAKSNGNTEEAELFKKYRFDNCVCELYKLNPDIQYTTFFKNYRDNLFEDYKDLLANGKYEIEDSDYCVVCSNPFEMIQHACKVEQSEWVRIHSGREAYCRYYQDGQDLIATRSPHIYSGNVICLHNKYHKWFDEYMRLSDNIVVINSIESDIMDRANSMDFDSDTMLLSSNEILVEKAKYCEEHFPTPICKIKSVAKKRFYCLDDFIDCDKVIADAKIGEIVDLSQLLESYYHDVELDDSIEDKRKEEVLSWLVNEISKLASISGCEIDRAKREFPVDTDKELERIRNYIANHKNPDNLLHGIIKTGCVEYMIKTVKKKYFKEDVDIKPEEKEDYEVIQKVYLLQNENDALYEKLETVTVKKEKETIWKSISENNKKIQKLLKGRTRCKENVSAKPLFFKKVFPESDQYYYTKFNCPMDYLQEILKKEYPRKKRETNVKKLEFIDFFARPSGKRGNDKHVIEINRIAKEYETARKGLYANYSKANGLSFDAETEKRKLFKNAVDEVKKMDKLTKETVYLIVNGLYGSNQAKSHNKDARAYGKTIMDILYNSHKDLLLSMFSARVKESDGLDKAS